MKLLIIFIVFIYTNFALAVGWEEISKEDIKDRGISLSSQFQQARGCTELKITLPGILNFGAIGNRSFQSASYKEIKEKTQGWQITSKGTQIRVPAILEEDFVKIESLCLSPKSLDIAYLVINYSGPQGSPPMEVVLHLGEYK